MHRPPVALFEHLTQRTGDGRIVIFATDFLLGRTGQTDEMIARDTALLRVKFGELDRFWNAFVVNDDGRRSERCLSRA